MDAMGWNVWDDGCDDVKDLKDHWIHTCTTGAQHRTLKERPILSGYRWQF